MKKLRIIALIAIIFATASVAYRHNKVEAQSSAGYYPMLAYATGSAGNVIALQSNGTGNLLYAAGAGFGAAPLSLKGYYPAVLYGLNAGAPIALQADATGALLTGVNNTPVKATTYATTTACNNGSSPAVCGSAAAGLVLVAAGATSLVVNTTAVTANSQVFFTYSGQCGAAPTNIATLQLPFLGGAPTAGVSFTLTMPTAPATNPICVQYHVVN